MSMTLLTCTCVNNKPPINTSHDVCIQQECVNVVQELRYSLRPISINPIALMRDLQDINKNDCRNSYIY